MTFCAMQQMFGDVRRRPWPADCRHKFFITNSQPNTNWYNFKTVLAKAISTFSPFGIEMGVFSPGSRIHISFEDIGEYYGLAQYPTGKCESMLSLKLSLNAPDHEDIRVSLLQHELAHCIGISHEETGVMSQNLAGYRQTWQGDPAEHQLISLYGQPNYEDSSVPDLPGDNEIIEGLEIEIERLEAENKDLKAQLRKVRQYAGFVKNYSQRMLEWLDR